MLNTQIFDNKNLKFWNQMMPDKLKKLTPEDGQSLNVEAQNIEQLKQLFPDVFREGKVDFEALKAVLGKHVEDKEERFNFTWNGKNKARQIAQTPSTGTLRPCKEESVNWDVTQNMFIEGDNLEVLKLLQKSYHQKVKMIYIDPPYNTGNEFVYSDDYKDSMNNYYKLTAQSNEKGEKFSANSETSGRYHTNWLNMMYPRLKLARNLLANDGMIYISIDDNEVSNLRLICDEIFGEDNFLAQIAWEKRYTRSNNAKRFYSLKDSILVYRKSDALEYVKEARNEKSDSNYSNIDNDPKGSWMTSSYVNPAVKSERPNLVYAITNPTTGEQVSHPTHAWKHSLNSNNNHIEDNRLWWGKDGKAQYPRLKLYLSEQTGGLVPIDLWDYKSTGTTDDGGVEIKKLFGAAVFDTPKPTKLIQRMLGISTIAKNNDIVLDFFAGSGSTAHSVFLENIKDDGNRRFIVVQLPEQCNAKSVGSKSGYETIADISKDRIRKASSILKERNTDYSGDLGFKVFKLDKTNINQWDAGFEDLSDMLEKSIDSVKADRSNDDLFYEIILKYGLDLSYPISEVLINSKKVYDVAHGSMFICLDDEITIEVVEGIGKLVRQSGTETTRVVFKDAGFEDDSIKMNSIQLLKQYGIDDVRSV
jgi:adenine-specific DNA-methyltransferase